MTNNELNPIRSSSDSAAEATARLADLLDRIGDALVAIDAEALLGVEADLFTAVAALGALTEVGGDHVVYEAAAKRARAGLLRCRRLGASFSGIARSLARVGRPATYDREGSYLDGVSGRPSLSVQIRA